MCGLFFQISSKEKFDLNFDNKLEELMGGRGPDAFNVTKFSLSNDFEAYFAHSRLAITGVHSAMKQPLECKQFIMMLNGEIYNYRELSSKYLNGAHQESDTNVLFHLVNKLGFEDTVKQIQGMYSIVHFDKTNAKLSMHRDPFGQKPLYVYDDDSELVVCSEPRYLSSLDKKLTINLDKSNEILSLGYRFRYLQNTTEIENLVSLPRDKIVSIYCSNDFRGLLTTVPVKKINEQGNRQLNCVISDSILSMIPQEVPYALPLSSGVDSNCILETVIKNKKFENLVGTYTVVSSDQRYDETKYLEDTINYLQNLGIKHTKIYAPCGQEAFEIMKKMVKQRMGMITGLNAVGQFNLFSAMKSDGAKVSISGIGADEVFSGYYDHYNLFMADNIDKKVEDNWDTNIRPIVRNKWLKEKFFFRKYPDFAGHILENKSDFKNLFHKKACPVTLDKTTHNTQLRVRMSHELHTETVPNVLRDEDFNSMYHMIESRAPFLAEDVIDAAGKLEETTLFELGLAKSPLRKYGLSLNNNNDAFMRAHKIGFNLSF